MLPNPCVVSPNPYPSGTFKYDFIEWWNILVRRNGGKEVLLGELFAEAAEAAHCAALYGKPPEDGKNE